MPEAPDLQVVKEYLAHRVAGRTVASAREAKPLVLRNLTGEPFGTDIRGRVIDVIDRRGKLLFMGLWGGRTVVINPMLVGGLRHCPANERVNASTCVVFSLDDGMDLRYFDRKRMGMVYYTRADQVGDVPRVDDYGPDVLDEPLDFGDFAASLRRFRGEIKGVLTRGGLVAGIGNAYADEILFDAGIFPYKKRTKLTDEEVRRLHGSLYSVPARALETLRGRIGDDIHKKVREFLKVHGKGGKPCPRCGYEVSSITANQRETNFCRKCQPGLLVGN